MRLRTFSAGIGLALAAALGGCADGENFGLVTAAIEQPAPAQKVAAKPSIDPACVELAARINAARDEGTPGRVAKVAENKGGRTVSIKRASLAKVAELDAMNEKFLKRCSVVANSPAPTATAAAAPSSATQPILDPAKPQ